MGPHACVMDVQLKLSVISYKELRVISDEDWAFAHTSWPPAKTSSSGEVRPRLCYELPRRQQLGRKSQEVPEEDRGGGGIRQANQSHLEQHHLPPLTCSKQGNRKTSKLSRPVKGPI